MNASDALDRLDQIHDHLTRAEVYRGFRVPAVAAVGVLGVVAAVVQPLIPSAGEGLGFVWYWVGVAALGGVIGGVAAVRSYLLREDEFDRRQTRRVVGQFLPCVVVGAAVTASVVRHAPELIPLLPGVWAAVFGLGVIATRPFVPPAIGAVGVWYLLVGVVLVLQLASIPSHWAVGGVFGLGHLASAWILWRDLGEDDDE
jgi:hypothetical protein